MIQSFEAIIDENGSIKLLTDISLPTSRRAVIMVFDEAANETVNDSALLSEKSLSEDWNRPEEDAAWAHLQSEK